MKVSIPLWVMISLYPEMAEYKSLPRKKKKKLKKKATKVLFDAVSEAADLIIKNKQK